MKGERQKDITKEMRPIMAKTNAQYDIESDARILVDAEIVRKDTKRFEKAVAQIKKENAARASAVKK